MSSQYENINSAPGEESALPGFIVIEGPIGVGKTTLANRLSASFGGDILLEAASENPFLEKFYDDPRAAALPTQLFFLMQRARQLNAIKQADIFNPVRVADFLIEKDRLFAELTLDNDELDLYNQVYASLTIDVPRPDLVVYLQAPVEVLLERIHRRGLKHERFIETAYLQRLCDSYVQFFYRYDSSPLLIVNAADIDFASNEDEYEMLRQRILEVQSGRHYFNPARLAL